MPLYVVSGDQQPRYVYTIGLSPKFGYELIFAGGIIFVYDDVVSKIITDIAVGNGARGSGDSFVHGADALGSSALTRVLT